MKLIILAIAIFTNNAVFSQCNGAQSFTLTPPPINNTYQPGQVVTMCFLGVAVPTGAASLYPCLASQKEDVIFSHN
jgi:hypothetical protein